MKKDYSELNTTLIRQLRNKIEELKESRKKYMQLFEESNDAIFIADPKTKMLVDCNRKAEEMTGYSKKEIISMPADKLHPEDKVRETMEAFKKQAEGMRASVESEILAKNKKRIAVSINSAIVERDGKPCLMGVFRDITEQKKAEKALRENENKYRVLLENLPQKIFLKDINSVYISCNENYALDLGIKADEIAGKTDFEFYPKQLARKYISDDKKVMGSGKTADIEEEYAKDGQKFFVHTIKTPVRDEKGKVIGVLGIFWDITGQKKAEEKLKSELNKLKQELNKCKLKKKIK